MQFTFSPTLLGTILVLSGALLRAVYVINNKQQLRGLSPRFLIVVNMLGTGLITTVVLFFFRTPTNLDWWTWPSGVAWPLAATALLNILVQYSETKALSIEDASLVSPLSAAAPLFSVATAFVLLQEAPSLLGWLGIMTISLGTSIITAPQQTGHNTSLRSILSTITTPWRALGKSLGVRLALFGAFIASISIIFDKMVVVRAHNPFLLSAVVFTFVGCALLPRVRREDLPRNTTRRTLLTLALGPLLFSGVVLLFAAALPLVPASYSSALRRTSILFVILLSVPLLKERGHPERLWGGMLMVVGAVLLTV